MSSAKTSLKTANAALKTENEVLRIEMDVLKTALYRASQELAQPSLAVGDNLNDLTKAILVNLLQEAKGKLVKAQEAKQARALVV